MSAVSLEYFDLVSVETSTELWEEWPTACDFNEIESAADASGGEIVTSYLGLDS